MTEPGLYGGLEAGGTKFLCVVGRGPDHIVAEERFLTTSPQDTLAQAISFFQPFAVQGRLRGVGIGSFGPCDLTLGSPTFGFITSTPKPGWANTNIVGILRAGLGVDVAFDTDVNAAALGEYLWGSAIGLSPCLYLTVGTGIGGGCTIDGIPLHGLQHPEMGHIRIPRDPNRDPFAGSCPYHGDCLEGVASGPAILARLGVRGEDLSDDDAFWDLEAEYLGLAVANYILTLSPMRIVLGGGIMSRTFLLPCIRHQVRQSLADYIKQAEVASNIDEYVVAPGLGGRSGVLGALALAASLCGEQLGRNQS